MFLDAATVRIRVASLLCSDTFLNWTRRGLPHPDRVLIVRLDAIGDFVLWLDAAQALVDHYKADGKSVILIANAAWAAWARKLAIFDDVIAVDVKEFQRSPLYRYRIGHTIRMLGCALAVDPTYTRAWLLGDSVIRISGASERIGSAGDRAHLRTWQTRTADGWYTRLLPADPSPCMELERNAEFLRNMGLEGFRAKLPQLTAAHAFQADSAFTSAMAGRPYYVLFPGASWQGRQWPSSNFIEVAEKLHHQTGWQGVVCGGPSDLELANNICERCAVPLLNWAGRTDLAQLASILSAAQLLLTNETSAAHIAAACGVPTVCLLGGGHYGRFMPYQVEQEEKLPLPRAVIHRMPCFGCNWQCIYERAEPVPCIERIHVDEVWRTISEALRFVA
jgi:ADP-heptose:LPS heptosyltransferase